MRLAASSVAAFLWVLIFEYFAVFTTPIHALISTTLLYALCQTTTMLLTPFALKHLRGGMRRALVYGTLLQAAAFVCLGALVLGAVPHSAVVAVALLLGAYRALYRVPYTVEQAAIAGRGTPRLLVEILLALIPLIAGAFLAQSGLSDQLFFTAGIISLAALVPALFIPNVHEPFAWGFHETFGHLVAPENRRLLLSSAGKGLQGAALFFLWPLMLLCIFAGSPLQIGAAFSATLLVILLLRASHRRVTVEDHAEGAAFLDEYTALKEMGQALGCLALAFGAVLALALFQ